MTARALTVRPGFIVPLAVRDWMADAARHEMALCAVIAFWLGLFLTVLACAGGSS